MLTIQVKRKGIPTYPLEREDMNPMFDVHGRCLNPFPYTGQYTIASERQEKEYTIVTMENTYLYIEVLPELGGRVQRVYDKTAKKDMFYYNNEINPHLVGTRGAWFAGGIEYNTPISHSPTSYDRIHYYTKQSEDSVAIVVGAIEQISSMYFEVELILNQDEKRFEQKIRLNNPTPLEHRFYFWTNAAVQDEEDMKLIYPFDWVVNHIEPNYIKWPEYKGTDYRNSKDIPHIYETFGKLLTRQFFAVYYQEAEYGVVHCSRKEQVKGAKFFSWGKDGLGKAWNKTLTHSEDEYIEIQSGLFETQSVFHFMKPHDAIEWSEYWYPVEHMSNACVCEKNIAMAVKEDEGEITFSLHAPVDLGVIRMVLYGQNAEEEKCFELHVGETKEWTIHKENPIFSQWTHINVYQDEEILVEYQREKEEAMPYPDEHIFEDVRMNRGEINLDTVEEEQYYNAGRYKESRGEEKDALMFYQKNIEINPKCPLTQKRLAILYIKMTQYQEAKGLLETLLRYNNVDMEARYYYGVLLEKQGKKALAKKVFYDISDHGKIKVAALCEILKINMYEKNYRENIQLYRENNLQNNIYAHWIVGICYRKLGMEKSYQQWQEQSKNETPYGLAEAYIWAKYKGECGEEYREKIQRGRHQLESVVKQYIEQGLYEESLILLKESEPTLLNQIFMYHCQRKVGQNNQQVKITDLCKTYTPEYQFFKEAITGEILESYVDLDETGTLYYLLGNYYYGINHTKKAFAYFKESYNQGNRYTVLLRNLGYIGLNVVDQKEEGKTFLYEDIALNPNQNSDVLALLMDVEVEEKNEKAIKILLEKLDQVVPTSMTIYSKLEGLIALGKYAEAYTCLMEKTFYKWEGKEVVGDYYNCVVENLLQQALEKGKVDEAKQWLQRYAEYPENLEYGDSLDKEKVKQNRYRELEKRIYEYSN